MKRNLSISFNALLQSVKKWFKRCKRKDDNDWFDHPYAIF